MVTKNITEKVEVQYTVDNGDGYIFMDTVSVEKKDFNDKKMDKEIDKKYADWKVYMQTPIVQPVVDREKELVKLKEEKVKLEKDIQNIEMVLTKEKMEKEEVKEEIKEVIEETLIINE